MAEISEKLKKKLLKRKEDIKSGGNYNTHIFKDGKTRIRILNPGEDEDFAFEAETVFLGKELGTIILPSTFGLPDAIKDMYNELKKGDDNDKETAESFRPGKKYYAPALKFKDEKGKELDEEAGVKLAPLPKSVYDGLIDLMVDDDNGDFVDPKEGYDVKVVKTGQGKEGTKYNVTPCKPTKVPKKYAGIYNPEKMVRALLPTFEETEELIAKFLNLGTGDDEPKKKKKKGSSEEPVKKKKKKKTSDM